MRQFTTRIPTFQPQQPTQSVQPTQSQPTKSYYQQMQPQIQMTAYQPGQSQIQQQKPQTQGQQAPVQATYQPARSPLTTTFMPRSRILRGQRNNPNGRRNKKPFSPQLQGSGTNTLTIGSGNNAQMFGYTPNKQYLQSIDRAPNITPKVSLADYYNANFTPPGQAPDIPDVYDLNGNSLKNGIAEDWTYQDGYWSNAYSPNTEADTPKFDYLGRPLGYGGQVIWDENNNVIPEVASQYDIQGLDLPSLDQDSSIGLGLDQLPTKHLGKSGRSPYMPGGNLSLDAGSARPQAYLGISGRSPYMANGNLMPDDISGGSGQLEKTLRYFSELGFNPVELAQSPALMNILFNQFMY